jgi:hypothetical protein
VVGHRLETVEVEAGHRQRVVVAARAGDLGPGRLVEAPAVQEAGQVVRPAERPLALEPPPLCRPEDGHRRERDRHGQQVQGGDRGPAVPRPGEDVRGLPRDRGRRGGGEARPAAEAERHQEHGEEVEGEDEELDAGAVLEEGDDHDQHRPQGDDQSGGRLAGRLHGPHCRPSARKPSGLAHKA